jgi:cytochrome c556
MRSRSTARPVAWIAAAMVLAAAPALAADPAAGSDEGTIKYRQHLMDAIGGDMGAIGDILKYGLPLPQNVGVHAQNLARSAGLIPSAFERRVVDGPTDAKPEVWQHHEDFLDKAKKLEQEARKLEQMAGSADGAAIGRQVKAVGEACGGCHEDFRKPKEESYMRRGGSGS